MQVRPIPRIATLVVAATLVLTACSGGNGSIPHAPVSTKPANGKAQVAITIHWPSKKVSTKRHPAFVSPSTMSIVVETVGADGTTSTTIANNTGTPATTLQFSAPAGSDDFFVSLYDQAQTAGSTTPAGQELGQAEVTQTIKAGAVNTVNFTVDGIVAKVAVALTQTSTMAELSGSPGAQQLTMVGDVPATVVLTPMDADGNAILAPGTVPTPSLQVASASAGGIAITPSQTIANGFVVTLNGVSTNGSFGLIASATDGQGGSATSNVTILQSSAVYVAYASGSGSRLVVYDHAGNPMPIGSNAFTGVTQPVGLAYDSDDKELFVADASGKLLAFDGAGNPSTTFAPVTVAGITSVSYINASEPAVFSVPSMTPAKRVIVGGTSGLAEYSATSGAQLVQNAISFTPTALQGYQSPWSSVPASGWIVFAGDPAGNVDPFDLADLTPITANNIPMGGDVPRAFAAFGNYPPDNCVSGSRAPNYFDYCMYVATGTTSHIDRLGDMGGSFGSNVPGSFDQATLTGNIAAVALDPATFTIDAVASDANTVTFYTVNDTYATFTNPKSFGITTAGSFTTPSSLGLSSPNAIAVEW